MSIILEGALDQELDEELGYSRYDYRNKETNNYQKRAFSKKHAYQLWRYWEPHVFMDAIHYHVRNEGRIVKRAVYIVIGIDMDWLYSRKQRSSNVWSIRSGIQQNLFLTKRSNRLWLIWNAYMQHQPKKSHGRDIGRIGGRSIPSWKSSLKNDWKDYKQDTGQTGLAQ